MNSRQIEQLATSAVTQYFAKCDNLASYINDNDKEPIWDGEIYAYKNKLQKNEDMIGRISTQVKGKTAKKFKENLSYPISVVNLKKYLHNGGCLYIVVQIVNYDTKIFYKELAPIVLKSIIKNNGGKKSVCLKMEPLPTDTKYTESIIIDLIKNCERQASFADTKILNFDDLKKKGVKKISFFASGYENNQNLMDLLTTKSIFLYAELNDELNLYYPIGDGPVTLNFKGEVKQAVSVKGRIFYTSFSKIIDKEFIIISIGNCLTIEIPKEIEQETIHTKVEYKMRTTLLSEMINEVEFILSIAEYNELTIGEITLQINPDSADIIVEEFKEKLPQWKNLQKILTHLKLNEELDMSKISSIDEKHINTLIEVFDKGIDISLNNDNSPIVRMDIANISILLAVKKQLSGKYRIDNYFDTEFDVFYEDGDGNKPKTSIYTILQKDGYMQYDNIMYDKILPSYKAVVKENPNIYNRVNDDMLMMLLAVDELDKRPKKQNLTLAAAKEIVEWLLGVDAKNVIYIVNYMQVIKREREFTDKEKEKLLQCATDDEISNELKAAIHLLLDNIPLHKMYFDKMGSIEQERFKTYPIYHFYTV